MHKLQNTCSSPETRRPVNLFLFEMPAINEKMLLKPLLTAAFIFIFFASFSSAAFACACCSTPGEYGIYTGKVDAFYLDLLKEIRFDETAALFLTEADFDAIK